MNEEKKLSKVLDEIFGSYINSENESIEKTGYIEQVNDYRAPQIDLNSLIENLFLSKNIITEPDFAVNRIAGIKPDIQTVMSIAPPAAKVLPKENQPKEDDINKKMLPLLQQAYIAKAICNQLCELFYAYSIISKSKNICINITVLENQITESKLMAELIYKRLTNKEFQYINGQLRFNSHDDVFVFIKIKLKSTLDDITLLKNNTNDINIKKQLVHIKTLLCYQLENLQV